MTFWSQEGLRMSTWRTRNVCYLVWKKLQLVFIWRETNVHSCYFRLSIWDTKFCQKGYNPQMRWLKPSKMPLLHVSKILAILGTHQLFLHNLSHVLAPFYRLGNVINKMHSKMQEAAMVFVWRKTNVHSCYFRWSIWDTKFHQKGYNPQISRPLDRYASIIHI